MAKIRFTAERLRTFSCGPDQAQSFLWDSEAPGLGCRATPAGKRKAQGSKAYVFQSKLRGKDIRITIGDINTWALEHLIDRKTGDVIRPGAREEARRLQGLIDQGLDPRQVKAERVAATEAMHAEAKASEQAATEDARRKAVTLHEAWTAYINARLSKWGERTARDHEKLMQAEHTKDNGRKMKPGVLAALANVPLSAITPSKVATWLDDEAKKRPTQTALGYRLLRAFLNWCADQPEYAGIAAPDSCTRKVSKNHLPKSKAKDDALQREQLALWFDAVRRIPNRTISSYLQILLLTGARREELATLRWENVDFQWHSLTIRDKVEGERTIPMTPYVKSLLLELKARNETKPAPTRILRGKRVANDLENWKPSPWVFTASRRTTGGDGRMVEPSIAHRKALAAVGLPGISLHGLRRSFGSLTEWVECPVGIVAQIQGHKPSATAEKHYRVRPLDLLRMWHTKIEGWMLEQAGIEQPAVTGEQLSAVKIQRVA